MDLLADMLRTGGFLIILALVFYTLEAAFPARPGQKILRPEWFMDLCFLLGQYLFWNAVVLVVLESLRGDLDLLVPAGFRSAVAAQPWWLQAVEVVIIGDFFVYWGHRWEHSNDFLWRFHAVHHSAEHLDWLAAHREHPVDALFTQTLINLPVFVLGFPIETLVALTGFRAVWAVYIHSNVRLPCKPLGWLVGSPELHHWHHAKDRHAGNFSNLAPIFDWLFGTYQRPDHEPPAFGIEERLPKHYFGQLLHPFRRTKPAKPEVSAVTPVAERPPG